jgi:hypothetical protein
MRDFQFNFDETSFNKLFPFYLLIDSNLKIVCCGESLLKLLPQLKEKQSFSDFFQIKRPEVFTLNVDSLTEIFSQVTIISSLSDNPLILRGQFMSCNEFILFLGSPWFTSLDEVIESNLKLNDFAPHDQLTDLLHLLKNQETNNQDLKELILKINEQKQILSNDKEEIKKLSLVASANKNGVVLTDLEGKLFWVNDAYLELTGYTKDDINNKTVLDLGIS